MTTDLPESGSALVATDEPPSPPTSPTVDVRPGGFEWFDGDRRRSNVVVSFDGDAVRVARSRLPDALGRVRSRLVDGRATVARVGDRAVLRRVLADGSLRGLERRLARAADGADASLVVWTSGDVSDRDRRLYDVVRRG